jgi:hypothetical protein
VVAAELREAGGDAAAQQNDGDDLQLRVVVGAHPRSALGQMPHQMAQRSDAHIAYDS